MSCPHLGDTIVLILEFRSLQWHAAPDGQRRLGLRGAFVGAPGKSNRGERIWPGGEEAFALLLDAGAAFLRPRERVKRFVPQRDSGARLGPAGLQEIDARAGVFVERLDRQGGVRGGAYVLDSRVKASRCPSSFCASASRSSACSARRARRRERSPTRSNQAAMARGARGATPARSHSAAHPACARRAGRRVRPAWPRAFRARAVPPPCARAPPRSRAQRSASESSRSATASTSRSASPSAAKAARLGETSPSSAAPRREWASSRLARAAPRSLARQRRARSRQGGDLVLDRRQPRLQGLGLGAGALFFLDQRVECLARGFHVLGAWQGEPRERVDVAGARVEPRRLLGQAAALQRFGEHLAAQPLGVGGNIGEGVQSLQERRGIGARPVFRARLLELPQLPLRGRQGAVGLGETPFDVAARADQFARQGQRRVRGLARQKLLHRGEAEPARRFVKRRARYARGFASSRQIVLGLAHGAEFFAQRIDLAADFEQGLVDHQLRDRRRAFGLFEPLVGELLFDPSRFVMRLAPRAQCVGVHVGQIGEAGELLAQAVEPAQFGRRAQGALAAGEVAPDPVMLFAERSALGLGLPRRPLRPPSTRRR